MGKDERNVEEQ